MSDDSVWDWERAPWATFRDALFIDNHFRRHAAIDAIVAWPGADPLLTIAAHIESDRLNREADDWLEDIDARQAAWHKANPGSEWDRRASA